MSTTALSHDAVMAVLADVQDPELHRSIVALGMVGDVTVSGGRVSVQIKLTVAGCPLKAEIQRRVTAAVDALPGVETIHVTLETMTDDERRALRTGVAGGPERPSPFTADARTRVLGIASGKGGVGKSSITANLAIALAAAGHTVGLLDADVYGYSIPRMMGVHRPAVMVDDLILPVEAHGVRIMSIGFLTEDDSPVIWRGPMLHKALTTFVTDVYWDEPDYLLVDLPPGTGDVSLSIASLLPTASLLIVTTPQMTAQRVARRAAAMARQVNLPVVGVIENMSWFVAPDTGTRYEVFSGGGGGALAAELGCPCWARSPWSRRWPRPATRASPWWRPIRIHRRRAPWRTPPTWWWPPYRCSASTPSTTTQDASRETGTSGATSGPMVPHGTGRLLAVMRLAVARRVAALPPVMRTSTVPVNRVRPPPRSPAGTPRTWMRWSVKLTPPPVTGSVRGQAGRVVMCRRCPPLAYTTVTARVGACTRMVRSWPPAPNAPVQNRGCPRNATNCRGVMSAFGSNPSGAGQYVSSSVTV
ncbi:MAG: P-loop NTPase [Thermoleophilia bacterium]